MISSGDNSMPPSIGWKMAAVICGKSAVVWPAALASSIGSLLLQPAITAQKISAQLPAAMTRKVFIDLGGILLSRRAKSRHPVEVTRAQSHGIPRLRSE